MASSRLVLGAATRRHTHIVTRVHECERPHLNWYRTGLRPNLPGRYGVWELADVTDDVTRHPEQRLVEVLLMGDVAGLGAFGDVVQVHRERYWRYLHPLGLAETADESRRAEVRATAVRRAADDAVAGGQARPPILTGEAYRMQRMLENLYLDVVINRESNEPVSVGQVRLSFRLAGLSVAEDCIRLPRAAVTRRSVRGGRTFQVAVRLATGLEVRVRCKLFILEVDHQGRLMTPPKPDLYAVKVTDWRTAVDESDAVST